MSNLDCNSCGGKLHLEYRNEIVTINSGKRIGFVNVPLLICGGCEARYVPELTDLLIKEASKTIEAFEVKDASTQESNNPREDSTQPIAWYDFNKVTYSFLDEKFISEKVKFLYDKNDYYFIPGLIREWNIGFLTPVFFNIEVLLKYIHHPDYGLDIGADTFGYIYKGDEHFITFGINENNRVIMWLGDIGRLPIEEQFYLRSENIPSDHSISSEFYEAEIEVTWAKESTERTLLKKRLAFNEKVRNRFELSIAQLDTETLRVAKNIHKLLVNTNDAFKDLMISLNELLVESINNKDIKKKIKEKYPELADEIKDKKGIKLLQLWLEQNTEGINVNFEIAPLYVLYDLRLVSAHLYSDDSRERTLTSCCDRLGLSSKERDYIVIASALIEKLTNMYTKFDESLKTDEPMGDAADGQ